MLAYFLVFFYWHYLWHFSFLFFFLFVGQGHFPHVMAGCGEVSDTNPKLPNEPIGSTGHVKSTTGQPWHSSQLLALSKSLISALSNVLWGSNCTTDLTQMKPFYPFNSPRGTTTTNAAWEVVALSLLRSLMLQKVQAFILYCNIGFVSLSYGQLL